MLSLKNLPIKYIGQLHRVKLVNFSVDKAEIEPYLPAGIKIRDFNGRALISMVNVDLRKMHPAFLPSFLHFNYRHVAFRLLIEDSKYNVDSKNKGIYFFRSFSNKPHIVAGGKMLTIYNLELANIKSDDLALDLRKDNKFIKYKLEDKTPAETNAALKKTIGAIDRAYAVLNNEIYRVEIQREKWPIEWISCKSFETNFFTSARFEGAFAVKEIIDYEWLPLQKVKR
jgi:hypothetical protein